MATASVFWINSLLCWSGSLPGAGFADSGKTRIPFGNDKTKEAASPGRFSRPVSL
ncbi:MAG TPA: hypothetical protein VFE22_11835 [Edaphobacter sp.]|nr:hypothetical protein [Edaphobacter sp.]